MPEAVRLKNTGLRGVTVADTKVSFIDGEKGVLIYRGYRLEDLAENSSFLEVAFLLLQGRLPDEKEYREFERQVREARKIPDFIYQCLEKLPRQAGPMDVLQAAVPLMAVTDPEIQDESREANLRKSIRLISRLPVVVAAWHRIRQGENPLPPDEQLPHAANFLWQLQGSKPDPEIAKDLDLCLILHAEHTFNASTFACREVVSTKAHIYAGVAAGLAALSGALHGGANARVVEMLLELDSADDIAAWVRGKLERHERIMGLGHAVYKTVDPRVKFVREMSQRLVEKTGRKKWYDLSMKLEKIALAEFEKKGKTGIEPNVDFASGPFYHMIGIPRDIMTPLFAIARISGWCAHIIEEKFGEAQEKPALYRPKAEYVGNYCGLMGCSYEPMTARK
ncbi:MAG: citrate/2-methylcitrate synthase [Desulfobacterales bacterium]|jgi:citrate synthase